MNTKSKIVCTLAILILLASVLNVAALTEKKSLSDLEKESDNIITGKVIDKKSYWENGKIFTDVTISSDMSIKGNAGQVVVKVPGGTVGDTSASVSDTPIFEKNEEVLVFLKGNTVVGSDQGKYTIKGDKIKENGKSLAEFVHNIKKDISSKPEKGKTGKDIDITSAKLDIKPIAKIPTSVSNSKSNAVIQSPLVGPTWSSIKYEGFEGAFPNTWSRYGSPTWCDTSYKAAVGSWSGWPVCAGTGAVQPGSVYPNNMNSWMVYGPFSLADATDAVVTFKYWTKTELDYDYFRYMASIDGSNFYGNQISGDWTPWKDTTFDLKNVPGLGDLRGKPSIWIAFQFTSDGNLQDYGTFLDEINIQKSTGTTVAPHITSVTPNFGPAKALQLGSSSAASDSQQVTITGTNFGTTAGSAKFWRWGTTTYDATIVSWTNTQIVAKVPGGISSYTKPDGTGNVQVVRGDGTTSDNYGNFRVTYSYGGGKQPGTSMTYKVNPNTADTAGELSAIQAAANTWSTAGANFGFVYGGSTSKSDVTIDGENSVLWVNYNTGSIATTTTWWYTTDPRTIIECDVVFNDYNFNWGTDGSSTKMDTQTIGVHEFGHCTQLLDMYGSQDDGKVMSGYGSIGSIKRGLTTDDTAGIISIYGASSIRYTVTTSISPTGLTPQPTGAGTYDSGTSVTVVAQPVTGYNFQKWTENGVQVSTTASYTFTINGNRNLVATYVPIQTTGTLSITTTPVNGNISVDGVFKGTGSWNGQVNAGSHTVSFGAVSGYTTPSSQTVTVNSGQTTIVTGTYVPSSTSPLDDAVDYTGLGLTTGGSGNWLRQTSVTHDGIDAAKSGVITHNQNTYMQAIVNNAMSKTLTFWWRVSSEANYDFLEFYIDGVRKNRISGNTAWQQKSYPIATGRHTLKWVYKKDRSVSTSSDAGYVDTVQIR